MKRRNVTQLERTREFARRGNVEGIEALIRNLPPDDAPFMAEHAKLEAAKALEAWRMKKRRQR